MPNSLYIDANNTLIATAPSNITLTLGSINGSFSPGDVVYQQDSSNTNATVVSFSAPTLVVSGANSAFSTSDNLSATLVNLNSGANANIIGVNAPQGTNDLQSFNVSNGSSSNVIINTNTIIIQANTSSNNFANSSTINLQESFSGGYGNVFITSSAITNVPMNGLNSRRAYAQFTEYNNDYYGLPSNPTSLTMTLSAFPEIIDIVHTYSNTATPANTYEATFSPYTISLGSNTANIVATANSVKISNSSANVTVDTSGITFANSTVTFKFKPPTAAQVTAGNYFLAANGAWTLLTVP